MQCSIAVLFSNGCPYVSALTPVAKNRSVMRGYIRKTILVFVCLWILGALGCGGVASREDEVGSTVGPVVELSWTPSTSAIVGYRVYRGAVSGGPYAYLASVDDHILEYSDRAVQAGHAYFYVVTAVGENATESPYSNEASATVY